MCVTAVITANFDVGVGFHLDTGLTPLMCAKVCSQFSLQLWHRGRRLWTESVNLQYPWARATDQNFMSSYVMWVGLVSRWITLRVTSRMDDILTISCQTRPSRAVKFWALAAVTMSSIIFWDDRYQFCGSICYNHLLSRSFRQLLLLKPWQSTTSQTTAIFLWQILFLVKAANISWPIVSHTHLFRYVAVVSWCESTSSSAPTSAPVSILSQ
jgi:hypothetical protein